MNAKARTAQQRGTVRTLYDQIGAATIAAVIDELYSRLTREPLVRHHFDPSRLPGLKAQQRRWFQSVLAGGDERDRPDLAAAHRHLDITDEQVSTVLGHLEASLESCGVDADERQKVMALVTRLWYARAF